MPQNFLTCDREQSLLMPPSLREWLPEEHLAWFILGTVEELDVAPFYAAYRADGHGRAAHDPAMMLGVLLYADIEDGQPTITRFVLLPSEQQKWRCDVSHHWRHVDGK